MKFKVLKGTKLFSQLLALYNEMHRCNKAASALVEELGFCEFRRSRSGIAGGISSIIIVGPNPPSKRKWKGVYKKKGVTNEYMPTEIDDNEEINEKIRSLPIVRREALNNLVGFDFPTGHPGVYLSTDIMLLSFPESMLPYLRPHKEMIEITTTEYNTLLSKANTDTELVNQ